MKIKARQSIVSKCSAIVIKVGTRLLTDTAYIRPLVAQISEIRKKIPKVILVSSGAVGLGMKAVGIKIRPKSLPQIQALAAIGQSRLMSLYDAECAKHGFHAGQLLLTASDIADRERHMNVMDCISSLWKMNVLPVINENDSVSVDELKFGDNDCLAALIAVMMKAELTIILTGVDGLYRVENGRMTERISFVDNIANILSYAQSTDDKNFSTGGMASKIKAAEIVTKAGEYLWIANGQDPTILQKIMTGEEVGTLFAPSSSRQMQSKKRWLRFFSKVKGKIIIDAGAEKAIVSRGKSLLPSGIKSLSGNFKRGDTIAICSEGDERLVAKGISNYSSDELAKIAGRKTIEIARILGYEGDEEAVHRDHLVL